MDGRCSTMTIFTFIFALLFICTLIYVFILKNQQNTLFHHLNKVFDDLLNSDINIIAYDESVEAALDDKIIRYINANKELLSDAKREQNKIKMLISDISHQIAMPICNIILYSDLLLEKEIPDESIKHMITDMKQQSEKLKFLFEVLVKTSRLESGIITVNNIKSQRIKPLILASVSGIYSSMIEKKINLDVNIDEQLTALYDMKWTKEAIFNILENAVKYTYVGGNITISATAYEMFIRIDISDNGIGISPDEYTQIFKRFYRSPRVKDYNGVGIGLYLSREIIALQGGYITVSSEIDMGSVFSVFILV